MFIQFGDTINHRVTGAYGVCVGVVTEHSNLGRVIAVVYEGEFTIAMVAENDVRRSTY